MSGAFDQSAPGPKGHVVVIPFVAWGMYTQILHVHHHRADDRISTMCLCYRPYTSDVQSCSPCREGAPCPPDNPGRGHFLRSRQRRDRSELRSDGARAVQARQVSKLRPSSRLCRQRGMPDFVGILPDRIVALSSQYEQKGIMALGDALSAAFHEASRKLASGEPIICAKSGIRHEPLPAPHAALVDVSRRGRLSHLDTNSSWHMS